VSSEGAQYSIVDLVFDTFVNKVSLFDLICLLSYYRDSRSPPPSSRSRHSSPVNLISKQGGIARDRDPKVNEVYLFKLYVKIFHESLTFVIDFFRSTKEDLVLITEKLTTVTVMME